MPCYVPIRHIFGKILRDNHKHPGGLIPKQLPFFRWQLLCESEVSPCRHISEIGHVSYTIAFFRTLTNRCALGLGCIAQNIGFGLYGSSFSRHATVSVAFAIIGPSYAQRPGRRTCNNNSQCLYPTFLPKRGSETVVDRLLFIPATSANRLSPLRRPWGFGSAWWSVAIQSLCGDTNSQSFAGQ